MEKRNKNKLGLTKDYLRWIHETTFGIVAASQGGSAAKFLQMRNTKDRFLAVPANENVLFWDIKTKQVINKLVNDAAVVTEVTALECHHGGHPRTNLIAVGYASGHVKVFEYETGLLKTTFTGHETSISSLAFDKDGSRLASGARGRERNIVLWDLVDEKGLFSLKGHNNSISKLAFLSNEEHQKDLLISSSIDAVSTIKIWDLPSKHCFCTIPGHASGVWSFVLIKNGSRLITGTAGPELKVYSIDFLSDSEKASVLVEDLDQGQLEDPIKEESSEMLYGVRVRHLGNILRNSTSISNRVQDIVVDENESLMICHSIDKNIELYGLRSQEEALTYAKKKVKKEMRKQLKRKKSTDVDEENMDTLQDQEQRPTVISLEALDPRMLVECEFNRKYGCFKLNDKVKALAITKFSSKGGSRRYKLAVMSSSNKIDNYLLVPDAGDNKDKDEEKEEPLQPLASIDNDSHRTDVRAVSLSSDNNLVLSASGESAKIWRIQSTTCIATIDTEYAVCSTFANAQNLIANYENRFAFIGTKQGNLQIIDVVEAQVVNTVEVCEDGKPLNSIFVLPDKTGIVCGGEDGLVRFYTFAWETNSEGGQNKTVLNLERDRDLVPGPPQRTARESITSVCASGNLLAVALLDGKVYVHALDTFRYFLEMYGHKFPVTTMDISDDSNLLITGSADKNIKIWDLYNGELRKSIFAHDEAITCVKFVPKTHYAFSCGRDKVIKQWDCDHFTKIQTLPKHQAEIWCFGISPNGKYLITGSHDKSLRLYRKTEEILVPSVEEETERELEDERNVFEKQENIVVGEVSLETGFASKMTVDTVKSTDRLIEAIDIFDEEREKERDYKARCEMADSKGEPRPAEPEKHIMTTGTNYNRFMLDTLRRIKLSELEEILLTLPFDYVRRLLIILVLFLERQWDIELVVRCATFLLKINFGQIAASPIMVPVVSKLKSLVSTRTYQLRDCAGFNMLALEHLSSNKKHLSSKVLQNETNLY